MRIRLASHTFAAGLILLPLLLAGAPASADFFQTFTGDTVGAPTFNRPTGAGPALSGVQVRYRTQSFRLADTSNCIINGAQEYDGYLHLYRGSFNPAAPATNLVDGDDDGEMGVGTSRIPHDVNVNSMSLLSGNYVLVTSGFSSASQGTFQNLIQCAGTQPIHGTCFFAGVPRDKQVCVQGDDFAVKIDQVTNHAGDGRATPVRFGSSDSAFFWFFNPKNFEVLIKVLNGCPINGNWWVFFAGTTNQGHRIQVGQASTNTIRTYNRSLGPPAAAETDTAAFPCI